jgi:hypothetical protein
METALKGVIIVEGGLPRVPNDTKSQTVKGLETRGLTDSAGYVTPLGVEAARQLGAEVANLGEKGFEFGVTGPDATIEELEALLEGDPWDSEKAVEATDSVLRDITPEMVDQAAQNLLKAAEDVSDESETTATALKLIADLDKPEVVPNREDKRKVKFQLKGALSRLKERQRVKRMKKYGSVPETFAA